MVTHVMLPLMLGLGLTLVLWSVMVPQGTREPRRSRLTDLLSEAGMAHVSPSRLVMVCMATAGIAGLAVYAMSESMVVAIALGGVVAPLPIAWVRHVQRRRQAELRQVWPDAIEHLASGIRAACRWGAAGIRLSGTPTRWMGASRL